MENIDAPLAFLILLSIMLTGFAIVKYNYDLDRHIKRFDAECQFLGHMVKKDNMGTHYCIRKNGEIVDSLRQDGSKVGDE